MRFEKHLESLVSNNYNPNGKIFYKVSFSINPGDVDEDNRVYDKFAYITVDCGMMSNIFVCGTFPSDKYEIGVLSSWYSAATRIRTVKIKNLNDELECLESHRLTEIEGIGRVVRPNLYIDLSSVKNIPDDLPDFIYDKLFLR